MEKLEVSVINMEEQVIYGVQKNANDKTVSADIKNLSGKYYSVMSSDEGSILPYFVLSRDYDKRTKDFKLFIGSILEKEGLESFVLPEGDYAKVTVKPKLGFLWGVSVGEAKRYIYTKWLPQSDYQELNMEFEFHTERSVGKHPTIDILFAVKGKAL